MNIGKIPHISARVLMRIVNGIAKSTRSNGVAPLRVERSHSRLRTGFRGDEGNALVEFTLVLPFLMAVLMGIWVVGTAYLQYISLVNAVGSGAQNLQQIRQSTTNPCADTYTAITAAAPALATSSLTMEVWLNGHDEGAGTNTCSGDQSFLKQDEPIKVQGTYVCNLSIMGINYFPNCKLTSATTEYEF
jgi:Flp pilus assembly protein TadG